MNPIDDKNINQVTTRYRNRACSWNVF